MVNSEPMCGLKAGMFYEDQKSGRLYFVDTNRVVELPSGARLRPTRNLIDPSLSSVLYNPVDVKGFREVDPLQYLEKKRIAFNELVEAVIRYHPSLQKEDLEILVTKRI